jgi:hypothetical protein
MDRFEHMSPGQRQQTRELFQQFKQLDSGRKDVVRNEIRRIRTLSPEERQSTYNSDEFRSNFSPQEQDLIRGMGEMGPANSPGPEEPRR